MRRLDVLLISVALPTQLLAQKGTSPDTSELTLLGLSYHADSGDVLRTLGQPDSTRSDEHPFDVGARLSTWFYPNALVFFNAQGRRDGLKIVRPGLRTRRGLAVGDKVAHALALYGPPSEESPEDLRWGINGRVDPVLIVEVAEGRVKSIFVGHVID